MLSKPFKLFAVLTLFPVALWLIFGGVNLEVRAERLPLKHYTAADGLASSAVTNIFRDRAGFWWFSTRDGLSRFDGREFVNYRLNDQPSALTFWAVEQTRDGVYWISTSDGLFRVKPDQTAQVTPATEDYKPGEAVRLNAEKVFDISPSVLFEDSNGRLWGCGGDLLLIAENGNFNLQKIDLGAAARGSRQNPAINSMIETPDGSLWFSLISGAARRLPDGRFIFYRIPNKSDYQGSFTIRADARGRIWIGHSDGLFVFQPESIAELGNAENFSERAFEMSENTLESAGKISLPAQSRAIFRYKIPPAIKEDESESLPVGGVFAASDGKIWITASDQLLVVEGENYRRLRDTNGFPAWSGRIGEDAEGNLWIGTTGVLKLARNGLISYGAGDGLNQKSIRSIQQTADGTIYFVNGVDWNISRLTADGGESARLHLPDSAKMLWTSNGALIDDAGDWWAMAENGLYRFPANRNLSELNRQPPQAVFGTADGAMGDSFYCAFKDSRGNLWFSTRGNQQANGLTKFDPATGKFQAFKAAEGFPETESPASFAEDKWGNLWFGLYTGGLIRYRDGRFTDFSNSEGLPQGSVFGLYVDEKNRLWLGTSQDGVSRVDDLAAEKLAFKRYTTAGGLTSNNIRTITGDKFGNIYAGTVRGVSRIEPETGRIKNYTTADGLAADFVTASLRDRDGNLWFGTTNGVSKLVPEADTRRPPAPQILISGVRIAGVRYGVSEFGQREVGEIAVPYSQNNLQIDFVSVGDRLRYQYRLEGAAEQDWSEPGEQRTVNFANLAPGAYRFLVRAVNPEGEASGNPATVLVKINSPFWQTWEFVGAVFLLLAAAVFALDRYRVAKTRQVEAALLESQKQEKAARAAEQTAREAEEALRKSREERFAELERVRTRIATDLHDDIGSSLTQIAVLSQVAKSQNGASENGETPLDRISDVSIELVNAMSDIVWAINPRKDNVRDLVQRMRRFAADILTARGIKFDFDAPDMESKLALGANIRREVFAIYKEALTNAVKYASCKLVKIELKPDHEKLILRISDDGRGFDWETVMEQSLSHLAGGNGLRNMQRRARELGGECRILSGEGKGTIIELEIGLHLEDA